MPNTKAVLPTTCSSPEFKVKWFILVEPTSGSRSINHSDDAKLYWQDPKLGTKVNRLENFLNMTALPGTVFLFGGTFELLRGNAMCTFLWQQRSYILGFCLEPLNFAGNLHTGVRVHYVIPFCGILEFACAFFLVVSLIRRVDHSGSWLMVLEEKSRVKEHKGIAEPCTTGCQGS